MKEAKYYKKINGTVKCELCPRFCVIKESEIGNCNVRKNVEGKLYSLVYGKPCSISVDRIEKKPFYHLLPGSLSYSIGTVGCNLHCKNCQNFEISQSKFEDVKNVDLSPEKVVETAKKNKCKSIAYTYSEPGIFIEYVLDTARIGRRKNLKNLIVSNGYINEEPLKEMCKVIDGFNIDLKSFNDKFYREVCDGSLKPVLRSLEILKEEGKWVEITNLVIEGKNDSEKEIEEMCKWIKENLGEVPLHFSRFYPCYKIEGKETSLESLERCYEIGKKYLKYVYIGNVVSNKNNTYCWKCKELLIGRSVFDVVGNNVVDGKCKCGVKIEGVWE